MTPPDRSATASLGDALARALTERPWRAQARGIAVVMLCGTLAALAGHRLLPGFHIDHPRSLVAFVALVTGSAWAVRSTAIRLSVWAGWWAVGGVALLGQALVVALASWIVPGVWMASPLDGLLVAWLLAAGSTLAAWATFAGTDEALLTGVIERARRMAGQPLPAGRRRNDPVAPPLEPVGVVFVQLDGLSHGVLERAVAAGHTPVIADLLHSRSHRLHRWHPELPATTPSSQLGILHGTVAGVPAFRWYDRRRGRCIVANRPADAALIETDAAVTETRPTPHQPTVPPATPGGTGGPGATAAPGTGLLSDDGVSIANLFTGGAPRSALTLSRAAEPRANQVTRRAVAWFALTPGGAARTVSRTCGELLRERRQARRAATGPAPRRGWRFAIARALSNGLLRDTATALVIEHMYAGVRSIYVDYVDYDEVAHHAGALAPESLAALRGLDRVVGAIAAVARITPRPYRVVLLSDHGQSQGATFADRYGTALAEVVSALLDDHGTASLPAESAPADPFWRSGGMVADVTGVDSAVARAYDHAVTGAARTTDQVAAGASPSAGPPHVLASGNLGLVYWPDAATRRTRAWIESAHPRLIPGLLGHPGIGWLIVDDETRGPLVLGRDGLLELRTGRVVGTDPLHAFGPQAADRIARAAADPAAPDLYINSAVDPETGDVSAFEPLFGSHGGLGGWQDEACIVVPADLPFPDGPLLGAAAVHWACIALLRHLGHRPNTGPPEPPSTSG